MFPVNKLCEPTTIRRRRSALLLLSAMSIPTAAAAQVASGNVDTAVTDQTRQQSAPDIPIETTTQSSGPTAGQEASGISNIVVTAQKRQQRAADVPISLSVVTGSEAEARGVSSTLDLAALVPNLTITQNSGEGDFPIIAIRGVALNDFSDTNESPSAVYIDGFYKANLMGLDSQIFDMDRIETLRGPQGALYGRNATGGLIDYITVAPSDTTEGYVSALGAERNRFKTEGAIGGPLVNGLSGRLSFFHHQFDGYTPNIYPGGKAGNALDATAVRGQLLYKPTDSLQASILVQYYQNRNDAGNYFRHVSVTQNPVTGLAVANPGGADVFGYVDPPGDPRATDSNQPAFLHNDQLTAVGHVEWQLDGFKIVSITGYEHSSKDAIFDSDSTPNNNATQVHPRADQFSQELRAQGGRGLLSWVTGLYYFQYNVYGRQSLQNSIPPGFGGPVFYKLDTKSWAAFANVDYKISPTVTATMGARYTVDRKTYDLNETEYGFVFDTSTFGSLAKRDDQDASAMGRLSWEPTSRTLYYATIAQGFKGGTFNLGYFPFNPADVSVKPEKLTSYEVGSKLTLSPRKLDINGAMFYYDYHNHQAFQFDGETQDATIFNRNARIFGAELEFSAHPFKGAEITGSLSHLDTKLYNVGLPGVGAPGPTVNTHLPQAPNLSFDLAASYTWAAPVSGYLTVWGNVSYKSKQYFDSYNSPFETEPAYAFGNVRVTWTSQDHRTAVSIFAENVTDAAYRTGAFDLSFLGEGTSIYARPRWVGAEASYRFGS